MKTIHLLIVLLSLVMACSKEPYKAQPIADSHCIPEETGLIIPDYRGPGHGFETVLPDNYLYSKPYCNPNNKNEFVYFVYDNNRINSGIYIYNMATKQKTLVLETDLAAKKQYPQSDIRWSRKGWLIFADFDANIYKIKPNGDSLTQLTFESGNFKPEWNYDGTLFCIEHLSPINNKYYTIIRNENGLVVDSLQNNGRDLFGGQPDWQHKQYILGSNDNGLILFDYTAKKVIKIESGSTEIGRPKWINEDEFIYATSKGIYNFKISNNQIKQLRKTINSNFYSYINLLDNNQMICERTKNVLVDSVKEVLSYKSTICIINPCDTVVKDFDLR